MRSPLSTSPRFSALLSTTFGLQYGRLQKGEASALSHFDLQMLCTAAEQFARSWWHCNPGLWCVPEVLIWQLRFDAGQLVDLEQHFISLHDS